MQILFFYMSPRKIKSIDKMIWLFLRRRKAFYMKQIWDEWINNIHTYYLHTYTVLHIYTLHPHENLSVSCLAWLGRNFDDYPGFQPKTTAAIQFKYKRLILKGLDVFASYKTFSYESQHEIGLLTPSNVLPLFDITEHKASRL